MFSRYLSTILWLGLLATVIIGSASTIRAQDGNYDQKAIEIIQQADEFYSSMDSIVVDINQVVKVQMQGTKTEQNTKMRLAVKRPNKVALRTMGQAPAMQNYQIASDGQNIFVYSKGMNSYIKQPAPSTITELTSTQLVGASRGGAIVLGLLSETSSLDELKEMTSEIAYRGQEERAGIAMHQIYFKDSTMGIGLDYWIDAGEKPIVYKVAFDTTEMMGQMGGTMGEQMENMEMENYILLSDLKYDLDIADAAFQFNPPEGAREAGSLYEMITGNKQPQQSQGGAIPPGTPAPAFEMKTLRAGNISLAQHKGKNVVVLDFWATWCPPCRKGLPIIDKVAQSYSDKPVAFYAVNVREQPGKARQFMEQNNLSLNVAMDSDGSVGQAYGASAIPTTIIIGKDGTVQASHVGLIPNLESQLKREIDTLLGGGSLAP